MERVASDLARQDLPLPTTPASRQLGLVSTPSRVEDPRVEAEAATGPGVLADVDAIGAEAGLGEERVGAGDDVGGGAVRG